MEIEEVFCNDDRYQVWLSKDYLESDYKYVLYDSDGGANLDVSDDKGELIILAIQMNRLQPEQ